MPSNPSLSRRRQRATPASNTAVAVCAPTSSPKAPGAYRNSKIQGLIIYSTMARANWPSEPVFIVQQLGENWTRKPKVPAPSDDLVKANENLAFFDDVAHLGRAR